MDEYLKSLYYDTAKPGSYSGVSKFWSTIKKDGNPYKLKYSDVQNWLSQQYAYAVHVQPKEKFKREAIIVGEIDEQWDTDLMDVQKFSKVNNGTRYLAVFIDLFSRYLRVLPMKSKSGEEMVQTMKSVFGQGHKPKRIRSDSGTEYTARPVQNYLKEQGVKHIIAYNVYHANYAERVIRTLKGRLFKFFTSRQTHRYIDDLQKIVESYNNTKHSSIGMPPSQVTPENQQELYEKLYLPIEIARENTPVVFKFRVGDKVRVSYARRPFQRGYEQKWSEEIFLVDKRIPSHPPRYKLVDLQKEEIKGSFYENELQKANVADDELYKIEKILKYRTRQGTREALIRWLGYSSKFDSWVKADDIKEYE